MNELHTCEEISLESQKSILIDRLPAIRSILGMTQMDLACRLGISKSTISRIEALRKKEGEENNFNLTNFQYYTLILFFTEIASEIDDDIAKISINVILDKLKVRGTYFPFCNG